MLVSNLSPPVNRVVVPRTTVNSQAWFLPSFQQWAAVTSVSAESKEAPQIPVPSIPIMLMRRPAYYRDNEQA